MYKSRSVLIIALLMILITCMPSFAVSSIERSQEMYDPEIRSKMELHIEKAKQKDPAKYEMMIERANNNITGCLSCHSDLVTQDGIKKN